MASGYPPLRSTGYPPAPQAVARLTAPSAGIPDLAKPHDELGRAVNVPVSLASHTNGHTANAALTLRLKLWRSIPNTADLGRCMDNRIGLTA